MNANRKHNKRVGVLLALFLGSVGAHRSYIGQYGKCLPYGMFAWPGIPFVLGVFEAFFMPRRVEFANRAGCSLQWKKALIFPVIGFILMYPTAMLSMVPLAHWAGEGVSTVDEPAGSVVSELDEVIDGNSRFANVFEGEKIYVVKKIRALLWSDGEAYKEQALPFLREMLPYEEFLARYMVLFEKESMHLHTAGPKSIPRLHQERVSLTQAELINDKDAIRKWRPIISVVDHIMERIDGRELIVGFKPQRWELLHTLNLSYVKYDGEYRLARVYMWDDPLEWVDIYEYLYQTGYNGVKEDFSNHSHNSSTGE